MTGRSPVSLPVALEAVSRAVDGARPVWCSAATWKALRAAVDGARTDLRAVVSPLPSDARWKAEDCTALVGAGRSTVRRWLHTWLAPHAAASHDP